MSVNPVNRLPQDRTDAIPSGTEGAGVNVLALRKGGERYVFLFDDDHTAEVLRVFSRFASDPQLSFTWYEAAILSQMIQANSKRKS